MCCLWSLRGAGRRPPASMPGRTPARMRVTMRGGMRVMMVGEGMTPGSEEMTALQAETTLVEAEMMEALTMEAMNRPATATATETATAT